LAQAGCSRSTAPMERYLLTSAPQDEPRPLGTVPEQAPNGDAIVGWVAEPPLPVPPPAGWGRTGSDPAPVGVSRARGYPRKYGDSPDRRKEDKELGERALVRSHSQVSTTASSLGSDERCITTRVSLEEVRKYAFCAADLGVLARFLDLTLHDAPTSTLALEPPREMLRLTLRAMKMLHLCDYSHEDICCVLAHTSVYFRKTFTLCGHQMDKQEVANAMVAQMYIAHSYVQDETCPLRVWHAHLFHKYCNVRTLNTVVMRLLEIRGYRLKLDRKDMIKRYRYLVGMAPDARAPGLPTQPEEHEA